MYRLYLKTLEEEADYSIQGEGLYTIIGLNDFKWQTSLKNIPGLWYRLNGEIVKHSLQKM